MNRLLNHILVLSCVCEILIPSSKAEDLFAEAQKSWAYQAPKSPWVPQVSDHGWSRRDLDRFIWKKLAEQGLKPSQDAEPVILLRRMYFDLLGLPPSSEAMKSFVKQWNQDGELAIERTLDELLSSPRFGERWGKHWLDVARFAESNGREANLTFPHAWRYRDYVIDAINEDLPFDRFMIEQIAGDLLPFSNAEERARLLVATGFLAMGAKGLGEFDKALFAADVADEQLDTVFRSVLGSSLACARCHAHFTEPYSMEDYYAVSGIFKSTKTYFGNWVDSENNNDGDVIRLPEIKGQKVTNKPLSKDRLAQLHASLAKFDREEKEDEEFSKKAKLEGRDIRADFNRLLQRAIGRYWQRGQISGELRTVDDKGNPYPLAMGVMEGTIKNSVLYERGDLSKPSNEIPRGFPKVFNLPETKPISAQTSGRLELAEWLMNKSHPLTARVMANRVWRHLFGVGLLRTVDQFGMSAEAPSHPEVLDHLAVKLMSSNWSLKALIKEVMLSRTYRQSSDYREEAFHQDPDNRLIWRMSKRRMDAEVIRDSILFVAQSLDLSRRKGSLVHEIQGQAASLIGFNEKLPKDLDGSHQRSVYLPVLRDLLPDVMEHFDAANPSMVTGDRSVTNSPLQALYLMNGDFLRVMSKNFAEVLCKESEDEAERVQLAFEHCFNRKPSTREVNLALTFFGKLDSSMSSQEKLTLFCQSLLSSAEFRIVD